MGFRHNNILHNNHFHKDWQRRVKTWFNQPARKTRRRAARVAKAKASFPGTVDKLRPVVRCPTVKYNMRVRSGRGFTLDEIEAVGLNPSQARQMGIMVDHRRKNRSQEGFDANVERLQAYQESIVILPATRKEKKAAAADALPELVGHSGRFDIKNTRPATVARAITEDDKKVNAYHTLRLKQSEARLAGQREKRAKDKAAAEAEKKK